VELAADRRAVEELIRTLLKGLRAIQLYLPNNPIYEQACQKVADAFTAVWQETDEVALEVTDSEFRWGEEVVYTEPNKSDNLALMLYKDGVRSLTLAPGVEETESIRLLEVLNRVRSLPPDAPDDLQTLLWEEEFEHVRYVAVQLGEEDGDPLLGSGGGGGSAAPPPESVKEEVQRQLAGAAEEQAANEFVSIEDSDSSLYQLEPDEVAYLKRELAREYEQDLRTNVLATLCDIFEFQTDPDIRSEILTILGSFVPHLLAAGDSDSVVYVLRETQAIRKRAEELTAEQSKALEELPARLSEPVAFGHLMTALEQGGPNITDQELERLFAGLEAKVFETALGWLPQLASERIKSLLEDALIKVAIADSKVLTDALESRDREVAHGAVGFAKTLALPEVVPPLGRILDGPDKDLRSEAVSVLEAIGSAEAMRELEKAIDDPNRGIRLAAIRTLVGHGYQRVVPHIEIKVTDKEFRNTELTEKKAFLEAYGTLAGAGGVALLASMLLPRGFMKKKEDPQIRACAALGLGTIGTAEAASVLQQAAADKDALVRNAVNQALRGVD
jgi:HEAT repeat protein